MSQGLKAQLKKLQDAKQYEAMIVLLEASDEPNKKVVIARIRQKMKDDAKAKAPAPAASKPLPFEEPAPKPARRRGCMFYGMIALLILVAISIPVGINIKNGVDRAFLRTALWAYCRDAEKSSDCDAWREANWSQFEAITKQCNDQWEYPTYRASFFICMEDAGV